MFPKPVTDRPTRSLTNGLLGNNYFFSKWCARFLTHSLFHEASSPLSFVTQDDIMVAERRWLELPNRWWPGRQYPSPQRVTILTMCCTMPDWPGLPLQPTVVASLGKFIHQPTIFSVYLGLSSLWWLIMSNMVTEIVAFVLTTSGWVLVSSTLPTDYWKVSSLDGTVITTATYWANLWKTCVTDSTGVSNCKDFPSMLALDGLLPFSNSDFFDI